MPGAPVSLAPGSRGLPLEALRKLREVVNELESCLPHIEQAQYWTGRRLWHAERRLVSGGNRDRPQEDWELRQTLNAAAGLNRVVILTGQAVTRAIRLADEIFEWQATAQREGFYVHRGTGVNLIYDPLGNDVSTQTPYLWPEGLGGHPVLESRTHYETSFDSETRSVGREIASSSTVRVYEGPERYVVSRGEESDFEEAVNRALDNSSSGEESSFWCSDGRGVINNSGQ